MTRIVGISGSPRSGGNTSILLRTALEAARETGAETKHIELDDIVVKACEHCSRCFATGLCVQDDDLNNLVELMQSSHGIIFGSPTHYATVSGVMKNFMDRSGRFAHLAGKAGACFSVTRRSGVDLTLSHMMFFMLVKELIIPGGISWPVGYALNVGDIHSDTEAIDAAKQMGERVAILAKILRENPVPWSHEKRPKKIKSRFGDEWNWQTDY